MYLIYKQLAFKKLHLKRSLPQLNDVYIALFCVSIKSKFDTIKWIFPLLISGKLSVIGSSSYMTICYMYMFMCKEENLLPSWYGPLFYRI